MAPGSVVNCISPIRLGMRELERDGPWSGAAGTGKPAASLEVREGQKGGKRQAVLLISRSQRNYGKPYVLKLFCPHGSFVCACRARTGCLVFHLRSSILCYALCKAYQLAAALRRMCSHLLPLLLCCCCHRISISMHVPSFLRSADYM